MFSAYVTAAGQAWADFDVYMPGRWADDLPRRRAAGIPDDLEFATKPQLAMNQLDRLTAAGLPARWAAFDEVYGRSEKLREKAAKAGLAYVAITPCDYQVTLPSGTAIRADQAVRHAVFERRSCGNGSKGPRYSDWAMTATGAGGQCLLIRRLISRPDSYTFYLCWAPPGRPATMTYFITIAGRRWPVEETFKTGKDVPGWDQSQARLFGAICRHTALSALAQLRAAAIRGALDGSITLPAPGPAGDHARGTRDDDRDITDADLRIPPRRRARPRSRRAAPPSRHHADQAVDRRDHAAHRAGQAAHRRADQPRPARLRAALVAAAQTAPGRRPLAPLQCPAARRQDRITSGDRKEVTQCNTISSAGDHAEWQRGHTPKNRNCSTGV